MEITRLSNNQIHLLAQDTVIRIREKLPKRDFVNAFPIPRGGIPAAYAVSLAAEQSYLSGYVRVVDEPEKADIFLDDIIDSGATKQKWMEKYGNKPFFALIDKLEPKTYTKINDSWIVFPWEHNEESSIEDSIIRLLQFIGEDPNREGLLETPKRVAKAWKEWTKGYHIKPEDVLKTFKDGANGVDEMVIVRNSPFYSFCEHHMAPFFGTMTIAYIPNDKIVGLSKLARVGDVFAKRLQVQERLTNQIADALEEYLKPKGVGVVIKARHMCIESRGVDKQGSETITSALRGVMKDKPEARAEFLELAK